MKINILKYFKLSVFEIFKILILKKVIALFIEKFKILRQNWSNIAT